MTDTWTKHFGGVVEGRRVVVETYDDGGDYRVTTTLGDDHDPVSSSEDGQTMIGLSYSKGDPVVIDGETIDEIRNGLAVEKFSLGAIEEIVGHFPKN